MGQPDPQLKDAVVAHLRRFHSDMCRHWFDDIEPIDINNGTLRLLVKEPIQLKYLQRSCVDSFTEAAQSVTGRLLAVVFVGEDDLKRSPSNKSGRFQRHKKDAADSDELMRLSPDDDMLISPDYSFENFVVGPGNRLAHAAAVAVGQKPGSAYNPLFIYGGVGLGKTHLLQAICQEVIRRHRQLRIYYISCDGFVNQFLDAVQAGHMTGFRHRFRNVDLLVIDDIHDLSKRGRTQEEFFHTFNSLYQARRQIVLSSDAAPYEIPDLEERLTSRFNCGLAAGIDKPDYETRIAILKSKSKMRSIEIPEDVIDYLAAKVDTNVRELEGTITKLQGLSLISDHSQISLDLAKQALEDRPTSGSRSQLAIQDIIDAITGYYGLRLSDLLSKRRHKSVAVPRQIGMWLARKHTRHSLEEIGSYFGGRDHTTVMHAVKSIELKCNADPEIGRDVKRIVEQLHLNRVSSGSKTSHRKPKAL